MREGVKVVTYDLTSWNEIATALGVARSTAYRWSQEDEDPLPVYSFRGRIRARSRELAEWARRQETPLNETA